MHLDYSSIKWLVRTDREKTKALCWTKWPEMCLGFSAQTVQLRKHECFIQSFLILHGPAHQNIRLTGNPQGSILPAW